jgi:glycosyltransferase involved in cell wall biosynthesis
MGVPDVPAMVASMGVAHARRNTMTDKRIQSFSVVVPVFNEVGNLPRLKEELLQVFQVLAPLSAEVIFVDDGSTDGSRDILRDFAAQDPRMKVVFFRRNRGQTAALSCGIHLATGDAIIPIDADLQNDPADIPRLLEKMQEGYSCVSGWRKDRQDALWTRKVPSWMANSLISWLTGTTLHDYGCTLKAYRADIIKEVSLYGEMHRFIPAYAVWSGARVTELVVNHRARHSGQSKYGLMRVFKVMLDLIVVKFLVRYFDRPMHFFGAVGMAASALGILALSAAIILKLFALRSFVATPLPVVGMMFLVLGVQFVLTGLLAEVLMRTYYESTGSKPYVIQESLNVNV